MVIESEVFMNISAIDLCLITLLLCGGGCFLHQKMAFSRGHGEPDPEGITHDFLIKIQHNHDSSAIIYIPSGVLKRGINYYYDDTKKTAQCDSSKLQALGVIIEGMINAGKYKLAYDNGQFEICPYK